MPRPRIGALPMTAAQRQARHRARLRWERPLPPARRPLSRPKRWAAAVVTLIALQDEYRAWLDNLPTSLEGSRLPISCKPLPSSTSRSCKRSTHPAATAATDTGGPPPVLP